MKKKIIITVIVLLTFIALRYIKYFFAFFVFGKEAWNVMDLDIKVSILNYTQIIIVLFVTTLLFKKLPFEILGLKKDIVKGFLYGSLLTIPMFIGYGYFFGFNSEFSFRILHRDLILAGFFEEFMFRGFVFGILYYYCGWGFISAVLIPSVFFGIGHLYQAGNFSESLGIFSFTLLASAGFAWFYLAWDSLWMVLFLHGFMDLAWTVTNTDTNVLGSAYTNIFRFTTLGLAIYFSVKQAKAANRYSLKGKLWINRNTNSSF